GEVGRLVDAADRRDSGTRAEEVVARGGLPVLAACGQNQPGAGPDRSPGVLAMQLTPWLLTITALLAAAPPNAASPVCALLDPEKTPRAALLEAKLLSEPGTTWVERGDIDQVLKEQKLQAAFGPQGVADRVRLGKILKADVLVVVRPAKDAKEPALEVAVSETAGGLRLLGRAGPLTKDPDADGPAMLAAVPAGLQRHTRNITD